MSMAMITYKCQKQKHGCLWGTDCGLHRERSVHPGAQKRQILDQRAQVARVCTANRGPGKRGSPLDIASR